MCTVQLQGERLRGERKTVLIGRVIDYRATPLFHIRYGWTNCLSQESYHNTFGYDAV